MGELGIVVGKNVLEPWPIGLRCRIEPFHELEDEGLTGLVDGPVAAQAAQIFMDAQQTEGPGAWRSEFSNERQGLGKKLAGHDLKTAIGAPPYRHAQRPEGPPMAIFGPL